MAASNSWRREAEFRKTLGEGRLKREDVDKLTRIALEDARECYKHVCLLVEKAIRRASPKDRFSALHLLSSILRASKSQMKEKDKYCQRLKDRIPKIFNSMSDIPKSDQGKLAGMLHYWRKERIFPSDVLNQLDESTPVSAGHSGTKAPKSDMKSEASVHSPGKRKAKELRDYDPSGIMGKPQHDKSRKSSQSSRASERGPDAGGGARGKPATPHSSKDGLKKLPSHVKFTPGDDHVVLEERPKRLKTWPIMGAKIRERMLPGLHLIQGVNGECHEPLWPIPRVLPPLRVPEGAALMK
ncbi:hypothetical protein BSKO_07052 [Bryopsis sp. KO-2023]|nr:hypothetical protein BSKO_07052 [Bryopsis sp. KO-2023]